MPVPRPARGTSTRRGVWLRAPRPRRAPRAGVARRPFVGLGSVCVVLALVACSSTASPVAAAEAEVKAAERALDGAEKAAADAVADFCDASASYVSSLDRYGDVLHATSPTVGDVQDAGADLLAPSQEAHRASEAVVDTRDAVLTAQGDLADAQDRLASAQAVAASQAPPAPIPRPTSPAPAVAPATVERVERAEADFTSTVAGITAETPLAQAAEQFNAAAVALETAWLQVLAQSGCLSDDEQAQAVAAASDYTSALQQSLADAGYYAEEVDGIYGPVTVAAVEALQEAHGLPQTGTVDKATAAALEEELAALGDDAADEALVTTAALQQTLALAGYWDGPVDGRWTDDLAAALGEAQEALGVPVTGTVDAATVGAFQEALTEHRTPAASTRVDEASTAPYTAPSTAPSG
ncbi:peptidoglycan-binding protein [Cellulomonas palmilytica]|nr:peptidoglycan-binding protein [Cellulomonas palmilytica]